MTHKSIKELQMFTLTHPVKNLLNLTVLALLLVFTSCQKERLSANGNIISETRTSGEFIGVHTSGDTPIHIIYGNEYKVELTGSSNLIPYFESRIINGKVHLEYGRVNVRHSDIEVTVTMPLIKNISLSGSAKIDATGNFTPVDFLKLEISGSGDLNLASIMTADVTDFHISGSGNINFEKLTTNQADISISGSGNAKLTVIDRLKASISGSGRVYYAGSPIVDSHISGSGRVVKL